MEDSQVVEMFVGWAGPQEDSRDNRVVGLVGVGDTLSNDIDNIFDALVTWDEGLVATDSDLEVVAVDDGWDDPTIINGHNRLYIGEGGETIIQMTIIPE